MWEGECVHVGRERQTDYQNILLYQTSNEGKKQKWGEMNPNGKGLILEINTINSQCLF